MSQPRAIVPNAGRPELPLLEYELFRRLIRDSFGLEYPPNKRELLRARLEGRVRANGLRRYGDYYRMLTYEPPGSDEWRRFAEVITNNETYFFREGKQLAAVAQVLPNAAPGRATPLRVLSAGCSSGEEAYGLAMVLASRLGRHGRFEVRGLDLSEAKLAEARLARYQARSFRSDEPPPLGLDPNEYLSCEADGSYTIRPFLRERVTFERANLAHADSVAVHGEFDVVFCRNVLIYAEDDALARFFASLAVLVKTGGYLFLGHSDGLDGAASKFRLTRVGDLFAYVRTS
ncbi:MAG TPA: protein-glutamate O-methyltransferase CheR [Polyangiaceae bacterium]